MKIKSKEYALNIVEDCIHEAKTIEKSLILYEEEIDRKESKKNKEKKLSPEEVFQYKGFQIDQVMGDKLEQWLPTVESRLKQIAIFNQNDFDTSPQVKFEKEGQSYTRGKSLTEYIDDLYSFKEKIESIFFVNRPKEIADDKECLYYDYRRLQLVYLEEPIHQLTKGRGPYTILSNAFDEKSSHYEFSKGAFRTGEREELDKTLQDFKRGLRKKLKKKQAPLSLQCDFLFKLKGPNVIISKKIKRLDKPLE